MLTVPIIIQKVHHDEVITRIGWAGEESERLEPRKEKSPVHCLLKREVHAEYGEHQKCGRRGISVGAIVYVETRMSFDCIVK